MALKKVVSGGYVRVDLRNAGDFGWASFGGTRRSPSEISRDLNSLANAIRSKVSKYDDDKGHVEVVMETEASCEFCGRAWTEESPTYNGGCCDKDQESDPEQIPAAISEAA